MRVTLALLAIGLFVTGASFVAPSAEAVGICTYDDTYNNMGGPGSSCQGAACVGYSGGWWQTCVLRDLPEPPPPCDRYIAC
jgi:hypothetical protein